MMGPFILLTTVVVAMGGTQWWTRLRIRRYYANLDAVVLRIRWQPWARLRTLPFRHPTALYRVLYRDHQGQTWTANGVCGWWDGYYPLDAELSQGG